MNEEFTTEEIKDIFNSVNNNSDSKMKKAINNTRRLILQKADDCVNGKREQDYGTPEDNFSIIADLWSVYLNKRIEPMDVTIMMALLKVARIRSGGGTLDSFIDLAGYAACGGEIWERRNRDDE